MQRKLFIFLFIGGLVAQFCFPLIAKASRENTPRFDVLDAYLEEQRQAANVQGMAIAVVEGDQVTHVRGFGVVGPSGEAVTPGTLFILGSTSKSFTALAIMQQVEAGKINLDSPVNHYLPWFPMEDVTVRHLLNQTSGIPTTTGRQGMTETDTAPDAILRSAKILSGYSRSRASGEAFEYSNANYIILGALLEAVSGQPYEAYLNEHILKPLNMRTTFAHEIKTGQQGMATGYTQWGNIPVVTNAPYPGGHVPAGYIISSAEDMSHYIAAQLNAGDYNGQRILSGTGITTLHYGATSNTPGYGYAMGWEVVDREGLNAIEHQGDVANFHANMILLPDQKVGLVVLMNTNSLLNSDRINHIAWDAAHLLVDQSPYALRREPILSLILGVVIITVVLAVGMVVLSARTLRWAGAGKPVRWLLVIVPEILLIGIAWLNLFEMSALFGAPIAVMILYSPDLAWPALLSGGVSALWAIVFPVLFWIIERRTAIQAPKSLPAPVHR